MEGDEGAEGVERWGHDVDEIAHRWRSYVGGMEGSGGKWSSNGGVDL